VHYVAAFCFGFAEAYHGVVLLRQAVRKGMHTRQAEIDESRVLVNGINHFINCTNMYKQASVHRERLRKELIEIAASTLRANEGPTDTFDAKGLAFHNPSYLCWLSTALSTIKHINSVLVHC
jgi:hypothetical protein